MTDEKPSITALWEHYGGTLTGADRGAWRKATCLFHEDGTPSAQVSEDLCAWNCFVCSIGGDSYELVKRMEPDVTRWSDVKRRAEELAGGGNRPVRGGSRSDNGLLPRRQRHRKTGGTFVPPWKM